MPGRRAALTCTLLSLCWGCATAAPLRLDDPVVAAAQSRLQRTAGQVAGAAPLAPDEALFLQAEAFYDYRFRLRRSRSAGSYLAQTVAAFTDFAPLTVMAASQGLFDLRLRSYDGAAQLYETLASGDPRSALRPLALYRLGWACRSTSEDGFPCASRDAFAALERDAPASPLAALARDAARVPSRSLDRATLWSVFPGAGQIYAGEVLNGTVRLSVAAGFGALALVPLVGMVRARRFGWIPTALSLAGIVGLEVTYTTSYQDAQRAVLDFNEREEAAFAAAHPDAP